ncbi:MAG: riboflavin kinase / adenylyltransferase [Patescibacteria group bacterium]|jgi:riboflavin kinase/FMN adenylyltransferase|nr:riboflavin kinase / adenylyltransferase [Patescibacteria group bacterium]
MKLSGQVVRGQGFATMAFDLPTANLEFVEAVSLEPGSYTGYTWVAGTRYESVMYVGPRGSEKFETHLFAFSGDLYGQTLEVEPLKKISAHVSWESEEQMKQKVAADVQKARDYFATQSSSVL